LDLVWIASVDWSLIGVWTGVVVAVFFGVVGILKRKNIKQTQKGGKASTNYQAGGDIFNFRETNSKDDR
jgi:hypothetical protein